MASNPKLQPETALKGKNAMAKSETGNKASSIAGKVLVSGKATPAQVKTLAASVLRQDETKGRRK